MFPPDMFNSLLLPSVSGRFFPKGAETSVILISYIDTKFLDRFIPNDDKHTCKWMNGNVFHISCLGVNRFFDQVIYQYVFP